MNRPTRVDQPRARPSRGTSDNPNARPAKTVPPPPTLRFLVTAGPTREYIDPVRYISNESSGKMGFAVAAEAARRGHHVTLVHGPVAIATPATVDARPVISAADMLGSPAGRVSDGEFGGLNATVTSQISNLDVLEGLFGLGGTERFMSGRRDAA